MDALSHPLVLRGAWLRVDGWYRSGNLAPQPELSRWRLHPEAELRLLREDLLAGGWEPTAWRQVPYPKKGACLRHYVVPTVKDQVAFMAYMVLLGPVLDCQFERFVFGNRWYRPMSWDRRQVPGRWVPRAYPMLTRKVYQSYARSHGLFRRVAHWTAARMTHTSVHREDYGGPVQLPDDYEDDWLPPWTREDWWIAEKSEELPHAYWTALDIEVAYPSVRLDRLQKGLINMLGAPVDISLLGGFPSSVVETLGDSTERLCLAESLSSALKSVHVGEGPISADSWRPHHAIATLRPETEGGLPTGLAISGILLNVVLHATDDYVMQYLRSQPGDRRGAIVRFADDMYVLSRSLRGTLDLIEATWRGLGR